MSEEDGSGEEYEEEEVLFYIDFDCKVDDDLLSNDKVFKLIGLETDEPILQLGTQVFKGDWTDTMGTDVFFEEDPDAKSPDSLFCPSPSVSLKYLCKTSKLLHMSRIFIKRKDDKEEEEEEIEEKEEVDDEEESESPSTSAKS